MSRVTVSIVEFDFENKTDRPVPQEELSQALNEGKYLWIDIDAPHRKEAEAHLKSLGINEVAVSEALGRKKLGRPRALSSDQVEMARTARRCIGASARDSDRAASGSPPPPGGGGGR